MSTETGVGTPPKHEPINSFEHIGDVITNSLAMLYSTLYSSGAICVGLVCWKYYPAVVRYRHTHVLRYRRNQLQLRRWVFSTPHMPKWDKRYLQRLDLPLQSMPPQAGAAPLRISCTRTSTATFAGGETLHRENTFLDEVKKLNQQFFTHPQHHNADEIRMAVREASKRARTAVVKVDTPDSVRSIQAGHEVWWLSADEARRESFCNFWIVAFAIARIFQDLFEMPDMPDFIV